MTPRLVPPIEALASAIERLRDVLADRPRPGDVQLETAAEEVARSIIHARRHLRGLEQTGRALLATAALMAPESPSASAEIEERTKPAAGAAETGGRKGPG